MQGRSEHVWLEMNKDCYLAAKASSSSKERTLEGSVNLEKKVQVIELESFQRLAAGAWEAAIPEPIRRYSASVTRLHSPQVTRRIRAPAPGPDYAEVRCSDGCTQRPYTRPRRHTTRGPAARGGPFDGSQWGPAQYDRRGGTPFIKDL
eukprot:748498-Hanusia_phi.AAC.3